MCDEKKQQENQTPPQRENLEKSQQPGPLHESKLPDFEFTPPPQKNDSTGE